MKEYQSAIIHASNAYVEFGDANEGILGYASTKIAEIEKPQDYELPIRDAILIESDKNAKMLARYISDLQVFFSRMDALIYPDNLTKNLSKHELIYCIGFILRTYDMFDYAKGREIMHSQIDEESYRTELMHNSAMVDSDHLLFIQRQISKELKTLEETKIG